MILIVSHAGDDHAATVRRHLDQRGYPVLLMDTASYPQTVAVVHRLSNNGQEAEFRGCCETVSLSECHAGWWRRPQPFTLDPQLASSSSAFAYSECHEAISGLWHALEITWMNPPWLDEVAHHKPYQLAVAASVGLAIPKTLITNDQDVARGFVREIGRERTIYKTFLASERCWRETRLLREEEVPLLDAVRLAPVIFQEYVPAVADLRVTIIGDHIFAAAIRASSHYHVDYRMNIDAATFEPTEIDVDTQMRLRQFMSRLGLIYGAIDLRRTESGEHVFLEINPSGEWLFVEERTGLAISSAMAAFLIKLDLPSVRARRSSVA